MSREGPGHDAGADASFSDAAADVADSGVTVHPADASPQIVITDESPNDAGLLVFAPPLTDASTPLLIHEHHAERNGAAHLGSHPAGGLNLGRLREIQTQSELEEVYRTPHYAQGAISVQSGWNFGLIWVFQNPCQCGAVGEPANDCERFGLSIGPSQRLISRYLLSRTVVRTAHCAQPPTYWASLGAREHRVSIHNHLTP